MVAPTAHATGVAGTPNYGPLLPGPVYALQPHPSLLVSPPTTSFSTTFSTSITASPSLEIPPSVGTLNPAGVDEPGGNLPLSTSSVNAPDALAPSLLMKQLEADEGPPLSPPAAPYSPRLQPPMLRKVMEDVPLEEDPKKLQQRVREQGGDEDAIARVPTVFKNGVSKNALKLCRRKAGGGKSINFDQGYMNFVGRRQVKKENGMYDNEWWCRLCPREHRVIYAAFKNLQPHLCSKHFGLPGRGKPSGVSLSNTCSRSQR
jgi:hypothetical protein